MTLEAFSAQTPIEHRILAARDAGLTGDALMREIADAPLYALSRTPVEPNGRGFSPTLLEQDGMRFMPVVTAPSRLGRGHVVEMTGHQLLRRLPAGYGVIFNPGYDAQIFLPPEGAAALKHDLAHGPDRGP